MFKHISWIAALLVMTFSLQGVASTGNSIQPETLEKLKTLRTKIRTWAPYCSDGSLTLHECPFRDALEYEGMLCLTGEEYFCDQVKNAQDSDGRFWRSVGLVGKPDPQGRATFSRDMARGAWAYIIAKRDKKAAQEWMDYVISNGNKLCSKPDKTGWDACATRATFWTFATQVFDWLELPRTKRMNDYKFLIERVYSPIEAMVQRAGDYEMLLTGEMILSLYEMEKRGAVLKNRRTFERIARILHRREPENALFEYLVDGPVESVAQKVLKYCPSEKPQVPVDQDGPLYSIEFGHPMASGEWKHGAGHYCVFMINLITGSTR